VLPNAVLFPGTLMPLHIFEPRYRQMLADALAGERMFAVGLARAKSAPCDVVGVGLVRTCMTQADGTSNLVLQGLERVRIVDFAAAHATGGYPVVQIEALASTGADAAVSTREPVVGMVRKLAKARARLGVQLPKAVVDSLVALENADLFADVVSYTLLEDFQEKQLLLETLDVNVRLVKLCELLQQQIARFELWKSLQGKLPNKNVGNN
jgi:Lon protease-like protein